MTDTGRVIFVMGVSGCGKSTVGELLAKEMSLPFIDADDYHPPSNLDKMSNGIPLNDEDRMPWLDKLNQLAISHKNDGLVIACSALKVKYRERLKKSIESEVTWVYLRGTYNEIYDRMKSRENHFMEPKMLESQFEALEEPADALTIDIAHSPEMIVKQIKTSISNEN